MRGFYLALLVATGSVSAVSTAAADQPKPASPSIIFLGSAEAPTTHTAGASMSIVSIGEPAVENINVAAVPKKKERPAPMPMVIRGGIAGDAFTAPPAQAVKLPETDAKSVPGAPEPEQANASTSEQSASNDPGLANAAAPMAPVGETRPGAMPGVPQ